MRGALQVPPLPAFTGRAAEALPPRSRLPLVKSAPSERPPCTPRPSSSPQAPVATSVGRAGHRSATHSGFRKFASCRSGSSPSRTTRSAGWSVAAAHDRSGQCSQPPPIQGEFTHDVHDVHRPPPRRRHHPRRGIHGAARVGLGRHASVVVPQRRRAVGLRRHAAVDRQERRRAVGLGRRQRVRHAARVPAQRIQRRRPRPVPKHDRVHDHVAPRRRIRPTIRE